MDVLTLDPRGGEGAATDGFVTERRSDKFTMLLWCGGGTKYAIRGRWRKAQVSARRIRHERRPSVGRRYHHAELVIDQADGHGRREPSDWKTGSRTRSNTKRT